MTPPVTGDRSRGSDYPAFVDAFLSKVPCGLAFVAETGVILWANEAFAEEARVPLDQLRGKALTDLPEPFGAQIAGLCTAAGGTSGAAIAGVEGQGGQGGMARPPTVYPLGDPENPQGFLVVHQIARSVNRVLAERAAALAQWKALFDAVPDQVLVIEEPGQVVLRNRASKGCPLTDRLLSSPGPRTHLERLRGAFQAPDGSTGAGPKVVPAESQGPFEEVVTDVPVTVVDDHGDEVFRLVSTVRVDTPPGLPKRLMVLAHDVTAIHRLQESEKRARQLAEARVTQWEALLNALPDAVLVVDESDRCVSISQSGLELLRAGSPTEVGEDLQSLIARLQVRHADGSPVSLSRTRRCALRPEDLDNFPCVVKDLAGIDHQLLVSGRSAVTGATGERHVVLVARDVTELQDLRQAEREARLVAEQKIAEWEAIFGAISDGIAVVDVGTRVLLMANGSALALGNPEMHVGTDVAGATWALKAFAPDGRELARDEFPLYRSLGGESFTDFQLRVVYPDCRERHLIASGGTIETPLGRRSYTVLRDVSELHRLERVREQFMQVVVHECLNPIQVMMAALQMMRKKLGGEDRAVLEAYVETALTQAEQLTRIVRELLSAVKTTSSTFSITARLLDVGELFAAETRAFALNPDGHDLVFTSIAGGPALVNGDRGRLAEVIQNLLGNSAKYTPPGKRIWAGGFIRGEHVYIQVEDEGIGIAQEDLERVFDGFYRPTRLSEWNSGGLGLGLYISRGIARKHGGDLWAANREGGGTVMTLKLPLAKHTG